MELDRQNTWRKKVNTKSKIKTMLNQSEKKHKHKHTIGSKTTE